MDHSITNVERKVLTKAFQSKTNDLGQREETASKVSNFSASLKVPPSLSHPFDASDVSRGFSVSRSFQQMFQNTREFDFSGVSVDLDFELTQRLKDLLASSPPSSVITFPGRKILISALMFSVPHTLQGTPGTVLEVETGPILIDFSGYSDRTVGHQDRVTFCELTLIFQTQVMDRTKPVLFRLTSQDSALELRDCHLVSNAYKKHAEEEESGIGVFAGCIEAGGSPGICVFMRSCNVSGFSEVANIGSQASLYIEKSHISECQYNFVTGTSLRQLIVEESVIERCHGSAVDIHIFQDARKRGSSSSHSTASASGKEPVTTINIEGSEIRDIGGVGVFIWSEHSQPQNLSVVLNHNRISNCKGEALSIKHVMLQSLQITSNDISCNQGTGCWLQKVRGTSRDSVLTISFNRSFDSYAGYGMYLYDSPVLLDNNECFRNSCKNHSSRRFARCRHQRKILPRPQHSSVHLPHQRRERRSTNRLCRERHHRVLSDLRELPQWTVSGTNICALGSTEQRSGAAPDVVSESYAVSGLP